VLATSLRAPTDSLLDEEELDDDDHARPRIGLVAMALGGLLFIVGGALFGMRWVATDAATIPGPAAGASGAPTATAGATTPAESESAIVIGESLRNAPPQPAGAASPSATSSAPIGAAGARTRPLPTPPPQPHDECDNPFTVDARGIRHPKPQCFKK
jgi:serine/threonine-protein kinase